MREVADSDFVGKTIKAIKHTAVNVIEFTFADDSKLELWAEDAVFTNYGSIPGFFVEDHLAVDNGSCTDDCQSCECTNKPGH